MFPLGAPLMPHTGIPLHVFEERYRRLMHDCMAGDRTFGIVMIERGSEVGGGEVRTPTGTAARIVEAQELEDGRWVLIALGVGRIRVDRWLPDDPYPRAVVTEIEDEPAGSQQVRDDLERTARRIAALQTELGDAAVPVDVELDDDAVAAGFQAVAAAGLGPLDAQRLLEIDDPELRLAAIATSLADAEELLRLRIGA